MEGRVAIPGVGAVSELLAWWGRNLCACVPTMLRPAAGRARDAVLVRQEADRLVVVTRSGGVYAELGSVPLDPSASESLRRLVRRGAGSPPVFVSGAHAALRKRLWFPLAARRDLATMLTFELDRETPFEPDEIYWTFRELPEARRRDQIAVELLIVPREAVDRALEMLRACGLIPEGIETGLMDGAERIVPLGLPGMRSRRGHRPLVPALLATLAIQLVLLAIIPPLRQMAELRDQMEAIESVRDAARLAGRLRDQLEHGQAPSPIATGLRADPRRLLDLLAAITSAVPDGAFLQALVFDHDHLTLRGSGSSAADVIRALATIPDLGEPTLTAPIALAQNGRSEQFDLTMRPRGTTGGP